MSDDQKQDLVFKHVFAAPIKDVWNLWSDAEMFKKWWGPDFFECPMAKMDFREGGTSVVSMISKKLNFPEQFSSMHYTKIVPNERIEYIHNMADKDGNKLDPKVLGMPADFPQDQLHIVTFKDLGGKTEVTITEQGWAPGQMMQMSKMGMEQCLAKMDKALA